LATVFCNFLIFFNALAYPHVVVVDKLPDSIAHDFYPQNVDNSVGVFYIRIAGSMGEYVYDSPLKGKEKMKRFAFSLK